jgi:diguanylate cyclase (GGDEF)-like protein
MDAGLEKIFAGCCSRTTAGGPAFRWRPIHPQARPAYRLKQSTRSTDICARIGGDEFVAICTQLEHPEQVHEIAAKLLQEITSPISVKGRDSVLGVNIGISLSPLHGNSLVQLLE